MLNMEENEIQPQKISEGRESSKSTERQSLDDATLDPQALIEQTGNFHQAESVQKAFTSVLWKNDRGGCAWQTDRLSTDCNISRSLKLFCVLPGYG
jgi:hypothetical protein